MDGPHPHTPDLVTNDDGLDSVALVVGGLPRTQLVEALASAGVALNAHAETLIAHPAFDDLATHSVRIVTRSVAQLGLGEGGTLPEIFAAAAAQGLALCPVVTAPYLRLAWTTQSTSANSVLSAGESPDGALNIAAPLLSDDVEFPKGFYLRVVDGRLWLRGYRCDDLYVLPPDVRFAFCRGGDEASLSDGEPR
ncbi:hypothetical protein [Microbacterium dextranolyticum]|uniref:Helicase n=1 Tax=Microbacterium dextranolyticum TaxID=36806 RepID=A0A9W6HJL4_9MICO|nr:hypothetical protein [Microbacterium dextranolyticum]MBM7461716.1 hypothetical protein [Microbacterium dextranolyticum]GLJ93956.1 hypothetical protein GCM10017591_00170 [Microbacterium dextranolyticum]